MDKFLRVALAALACCWLPQLHAQSGVYVPRALDDWRPWVLEGEEHRACPFFGNRMPGAPESHVCAWPRRLNLVVVGAGARFDQRWRVDADAWVPLPGDLTHWPQDVTVDGRSARVVARDNLPQVFLTPGTYKLAGFLRWASRPASVPVPPPTGLVELSVDGEGVRHPRREGNALYLGERAEQGQEQEKLDIRVYRLIADGIPLTVTTRVSVDVSGPSREETLGRALLDGFVPMDLTSPLPARLGKEGELIVQVRPGSWELSMVARAASPDTPTLLRDQESVWPDEEIWSYRSQDRLRITSVEGGQAVDPVQAGVPGEWQQFPGFRMTGGDGLEITERTRGLSEQDGNQLVLNRDMWLDFDRGGLTTRDQISGIMRRDWRLDVGLPYRMQSASERGENLLVTDAAEAGGTGVEVRSPDVDVQTVSRVIWVSGGLPVSGYRGSFDSVVTRVHLPPGYRLFRAGGVDRADAWLDRWRLLDLFLVLIIAVAVGKLLRPWLGALTLLMLALTYHEAQAPAWSWLNLLVAMALATAAPEGRLRRWARGYRNVSFVALLVVVVPFLAAQARLALFPQLEQYSVGDADPRSITVSGARPERGLMLEREARIDEEADRLEQAQMADSVPATPASQRLRALKAPASAPPDSFGASYSRYEPKALVQTGPGVPNWTWHRHRLSWAGPVTAAQEVELSVLPPWAVSLWRGIGIVLIVVVLLALSRSAFGLPRRLPFQRASPLAGTVVVALTLGLAPSQDALAQQSLPGPELLNDLKQRLTRAPECSPQCGELTRAVLEAEDSVLTVRLWMHALENVAMPVPGDPKAWQPSRVEVEGVATSMLYRDAAGVLWLNLEPGTHQVMLRGRIPPVAAFGVAFPQRPRFVQVSADAWDYSGVNENRLLSGSIEFVRKASDDDEDASDVAAVERFEPFVRVVRRLDFGIDWHVSTVVHRLAPARGAFTMEIPLLDGESVISPDIEVRDGSVLVAMQAGAASVAWRSNLPLGEQIELTAAGEGWSDVWQIAATPIWHVAGEGLPAVMPAQLNSDFWIPEYYPLPGEKLRLSITRPAGAEGKTFAIDTVDVTTQLGKRSRESTLNFSYRSTRGGQHAVRLPVEAQVLEVKTDGRPIPLRPENGSLPVPLVPGTHSVELRWRIPAEIDYLERTAEVDLGAASSNIRLGLVVPPDRWVLFASGPPGGSGHPVLAGAAGFRGTGGDARAHPAYTAPFLGLVVVGFGLEHLRVADIVAGYRVAVCDRLAQGRGAWRLAVALQFDPARPGRALGRGGGRPAERDPLRPARQP